MQTHTKELSRLYRIYYIPFIVLIMAGEIVWWVLLLFYEATADRAKTLELFTQAVITISMTGAGISVPMLIQKRNEEEKDRKILVYHLGLVWQELRIDRYILQQIHHNFQASSRIFKLTVGVEILRLLHIKVNAIIVLVNDLTNSAFIASQNSGSITRNKSDEVLNNIMQAYENIKNLQVQFHALAEDLKMKHEIISKTLSDKNPKDMQDLEEIVGEIKARMEKLSNEVDFTHVMVVEAINSTNSELDKLNVKAEEEKRYPMDN